MKYAVLVTGGKQYKVSEDDLLEVEHLDTQKDNKVIFSDILLYADEDNVQVGTPYVKGVSVETTVLEHMRGEKIRVAKFKAKARYRRVTGHRQSLTKIKIDKIVVDGLKAESKSKKPKKEAVI